MDMIWILVGVTLVLYIWYTRIIGRKNSALEALSGIDVQLKKRSNLNFQLQSDSKLVVESPDQGMNQFQIYKIQLLKLLKIS